MLLDHLKKFAQQFLNTEKRHPTLTIVILNTYLICALLLAFVILPTAYHDDPTLVNHVPIIYRVLPLFFVICLVALMRFKKWGFYGLAASAALLFGTACYFHQYQNAFMHLLPLLILYLALNIGGPRSTWRQLS